MKITFRIADHIYNPVHTDKGQNKNHKLNLDFCDQ